MENNMDNKMENKRKRDPWAETEPQTELQRISRHRSLDRFLEGWTVREVLQPDGMIRRESVYVGDYFFSNDTKKQSIARKLLYCLLFAAAIALLVICAIQRVGANITSYVGLSQGVVLMAAIWVLHSLFTYVTAPQEMTVADFKGGALSLKRSSFYLALSYLLPVLATVIHAITDPADLGRELLCVLGYLAAGVLIFFLHRTESRVKYNSKPSPEKNWVQPAFDETSDTED